MFNSNKHKGQLFLRDFLLIYIDLKYVYLCKRIYYSLHFVVAHLDH